MTKLNIATLGLNESERYAECSLFVMLTGIAIILNWPKKAAQGKHRSSFCYSISDDEKEVL